ncbi:MULTISPECIES: PilW family protein [unclassified Arsukibacterium]|uniref:PilW family protein n=1 Tax=unclassified Arsukibacterium TaxID=2635278 RepID=UPI000C3A7D09|nr:MULTISPECIES: PilW family protein [unclassified Arsukibacterium]MAA94179.1 pilus assembly protein PilW [Rheinheimera sp.]MBM34430.1 pilus assembly protein PilW [Rheinheimera sp.]HAW93946.1 pilus assembly protein PilW [Candidatus Azambacteria bacterium]|tara:strand:+ start:36412 stop:37362 length:951 start_codon:yes stop_codon:yes gene_type:complete
MLPRGFSLVELLIAMLLGLVLLGFTVQIFASLAASSRQAQQLAQLQQNGQLALNLLHNELQNTGFWGGVSLSDISQAAVEIMAPTPDCVEDDMDSGSFPVEGQIFTSLYGKVATSGRQLNCLTSLAVDSEILQLKRAIGLAVTAAELRPNRFYITPHWQQSRFVSQDSAGIDVDSVYYPYQHLVFYIQNQRVDGQIIPVLMRKRLVRSAAGSARIATDSVIDGVERLHFEFGIDTDADGSLNYMLPTVLMSKEHWQQQLGKIVSIRFYILLRSTAPDPRYLNQQSYQMGSSRFEAPDDHYRRLLLAGSVYFNNAAF